MSFYWFYNISTLVIICSPLHAHGLESRNAFKIVVETLSARKLKVGIVVLSWVPDHLPYFGVFL
jgi:hypothetical protein